MPLTIELLEDGEGIQVSATGDVNGRQIIEANEEIFASNPLSGRRYQIIDYTGAESYDVSTSEIQTLAKQDLAAWDRKPDMIIAIVSEDDLVYGISRMWEGFIGAKSSNTGVFRTVGEARAWIDSMLSDI